MYQQSICSPVKQADRFKYKINKTTRHKATIAKKITLSIWAASNGVNFSTGIEYRKAGRDVNENKK